MLFPKRIIFDNYCAFKGEDNEFNIDETVTLLIGRNNIGKSSIIDLVALIFGSALKRDYLPHPRKIVLGFDLNEEIIASVFLNQTFGGGIDGNHYEFGKQFIGRLFFVEFWSTPGVNPGFSMKPFAKLNCEEFDPSLDLYWKRVSDAIVHLFSQTRKSARIYMLASERDIRPEPHSDNDMIDKNGNNASNLIRSYINDSEKNEEKIETVLLNALNSVMYPDTQFDSIRIQSRFKEGKEEWEIYLQEKGQDRIPLSSFGSGVKTILLVILNQLILPTVHQESNIFFFEELENNLHPSLQRRLFDFVYTQAKQSHSKVILTSHSPIAINHFFAKENCGVYRIGKTKKASRIERVSSSSEGRHMLEDLGIKASDLFQANGVIWVEGPSDRAYINAWIKAKYGDEVAEGKDYQFLYYGGKLLSHYTADQVEEKIDIMFTNPNSLIVIDSDRKGEKKDINSTKQRIRREFRKHGLPYWITQGKEIENYLSIGAIKEALGTSSPQTQIGQFDLFSNYIDVFYKNFPMKKVEFAREIAPHIKLEDLNVMDLEKQIDNIYNAIKSWN